MVKKLIIHKLFRRFDYEIEFMAGNITILTGPNGFGKSSVLKVLNALSRGNLQIFYTFEFEQIIVQLEKGSVVLKKRDKAVYVDNLQIPKFEEEDLESISYLIRRGAIRKSEDGYYIDKRSGKEIPADDVYLNALIGDETAFNAPYSLRTEEPEIFKRIREYRDKVREVSEMIGKIRFISDQRLIKQVNSSRRDEPNVVEVIEELPKKLKDEISKVLEEYSQVSNQLDSSYPNRLFSADIGILDQEEYDRCRKEANEKFSKLNKYGLSDQPVIELGKYDQKYSTALKIYYDDFSKKYRVFQTLIAKLDLFTEIINNRLTFKKLIVSREEGFIVRDENTPEKCIELSKLSSGEKQEIVLFYELIFNSDDDLLLLIDEPEMSLHVSWQQMFLDDLMKVSKITNLKFIIATHSPYIISNHWDIMIDLGELYGCKL